MSVVSVPVTVSNARGAFVGGLSRENFRLRVDGEPQRIEYFAAEQEPAQLLLLVETGSAVYLLRDEHISAAAALLGGLATGDRVAVPVMKRPRGCWQISARTKAPQPRH